MPTVTTLSGNTVVVDMLTKDFEGFRSAILDPGGLADSATPNWTDRSELDVGVVLIEDCAFMADNLSYHYDRCTNEALWPSLTQRRSCIEQAALIDYQLSAAVSAQAPLTIITNDVGTLDAGQQVAVDTADGSEEKIFELEEEFISTGPGTYTDVIALHGTTVDEVRSSDGSPAMQRILGSKPLALTATGQSSLVIDIQEGPLLQRWTLVRNFHESGSEDRHYRVYIDEEDVITVAWGNGVKGMRPPSGVDNLFFSYRVGGGSEGNEVGPNTITVISNKPSFVDSVTNTVAPTGGSPKETIEEAKVNAPSSLVAMDRALSHADYAALARRLPGVSAAVAYRGNGPMEEVVVIASKGDNPVPTGSWDPFLATGTGLLGSAGDYIEARKCTPTILYMKAIEAVGAWLTIEVFLLEGASRRVAKKAVEKALSTELDVQNFLMGIQMSSSRIDEIVEGVAGVDYLNILRFQRQPYAREILAVDNIDLTFTSIVVNELTRRDIWTVKFTSSTTFAVSGQSLGVQPSGTIDVPYELPDGGLTFTVNSGLVPPAPGNTWEIITGPYIGNMDPQFFEACYLSSERFFLSLKGGTK